MLVHDRRGDRPPGRARAWLTAWTLLLLAGLLWPGQSTSELDPGFLPDLPEGSDKLVHALLFAVETAFLWRWLDDTGRPSPLLGAVVLAVALGATTEFLQRWVPQRQTEAADLAANLAGIAVSAGAVSAVRRSRSAAGFS